MLFKYYDADGSGYLDYKEFCAMVTGNISTPAPMEKTAKYG
jgi:Ca2+-binding EF-hand superfamily protein